MINKIELWLNIVHYCIYKADYKLHMLSNKINPFVLIGKITAVKRKFEEQGTTHLDAANKIWTDKRFGFGVMISGGVLPSLLFFFFWAIFTIISGILGYQFKVDFYHLFFFLVPAILLSYPLVLKDARYIKYFKNFDKWSKIEKWKYSLLSLAFIITVIALFVYSFRFIPKL
jgi:hypothetical protein